MLFRSGVPERLHLNDAAGTAVELVPFHAGEVLPWRLESVTTQRDGCVSDG